MLSFPHFYLADDSLRTAVDGISPPEKEKHQLFIDVQPVSVLILHEIQGVSITLMVFSFLPKNVHFISKNAISCLFLKNVSPS